jgi:hypothetical protein
MQDLTLLGHVAFLRHYAVQLQALAYASPTIAAKLRQIAHSLEMDGDALENIVSGEGLTEAWQEACVAPTRDVTKPPHNAGDRHLRSERNSDAAFSDCLDAIQQGVDAALHWPRPQSD